MENEQPIESWLRTQADVVKQRGSMANYDGRYHERMAEAADRIRKLEAENAALRCERNEWKVVAEAWQKAAEFEKTDAKLRAKMAHASPKERVAGIVRMLTEWSAMRVRFNALRQQQGEPVAWMREWEGDVSDLGHTIFTDDPSDLNDGSVWEPLYREAAPRVPEGWKPIETAPQDENLHVLLFGNGPNIEECCFVGFWNSRAYGVKGWYGLDGKLHTPTHWMPHPHPRH